MSRGDSQETAESGRQWQRTMREVNQNDKMASPAPNKADRMQETMGDSPVLSLEMQPKKTVKHQHMSTRNLPLLHQRTHTNTKHSDGHLKPKVYLPRWHRLPLEGERHVRAANGYTCSSSRQSMPQKLGASPNELDTLVTLSIESEIPDSGETPRVRLGSVHWPADNANSLGSRTEMLEGQTEMSRAQMDTLNTSNGPETAGMSNGKGAETYLGAGDAKRDVHKTDGIESHADGSIGRRDTPSVQTDALMPANAPETIRPPQFESKRPNSPADAAMQCSNEPDGCRDRTDASSMHTDAETAVNAPAIVRTTRKRGKPPNSPTQSAKQLSDKPNSCGYHLDRSDGRMDMQNAGNKMETPADEAETISMRRIEPKPPQSLTMGANSCANKTDRSSHHPGTLNMRMQAITPADEVGNIRTRQIDPKTRNSPHTRETATPESTYQWKRVSLRGIDIYVPWNVPIDRTSRKFVLG